MIINIEISKDLKVNVAIDDELIHSKPSTKWEFAINKQTAWKKAMEELEKESKI